MTTIQAIVACACLLLASVAVAQDATTSQKWQYYCYGSAAEFASAAANVEIMVLPNAGASLTDLRPARELYEAEHPELSPSTSEVETSGDAVGTATTNSGVSTQEVVAKIEPLLRGHCCASLASSQFSALCRPIPVPSLLRSEACTRAHEELVRGCFPLSRWRCGQTSCASASGRTRCARS